MLQQQDEAQGKTTNNKWVTRCGVQLTTYHKNILSSQSEWLDDLIITASQNMLKKQYPHIKGLHATSLSQILEMVSPPDGEFVQVLNVTNNHWIALSTVGCKASTIKVFDSSGMSRSELPNHTLKVIARLMQCKKRSITIEFVNVQQQEGADDCGLFALAFITTICSGHDPSIRCYEQRAMRRHLSQCIQKGHMTEFPCKKVVQKVIEVHCICRLIDDGSEMIQCNKCKEKFHVACIIRDENNSIQEWYCLKCKCKYKFSFLWLTFSITETVLPLQLPS